MTNILVLAILIDIVFGELPNKIHPVAIIGKLISVYENIFYNLKNKFLGGFLLFISTHITIITVIFFLLKILKSNYLLFPLKVFIVYSLISVRGMIDHAMKIYQALSIDINLAKENLKLIVSRDVDAMNEQDIIKSSIESIAENFCDAFFAPIFYGVIFGIYGIIFYRVTNTLDAMVGYKNEKYMEFGKFSARSDDILNFIPARLQLIILLPVSQILFKNGLNSLEIYKKFRNTLSSPNSGCGISLFAGALNITLGGDTYYFGKLVNKPLITGGGDLLTKQKLLDAIFLYLYSAIFTVLLIIIFQLLWSQNVPFNL
ncbi:adenosylcobinamide-phosphate synthase CbiB [Calditerrivibrio nitroreducens]|uniref:Cobalamin biosynthesis protein CobD n=1 Tax=Calditerrivibrio nitroreducens (strain DSM 19672 / NBRC 101217 / Yu37-1) TaxID=768670 RepID=E4TKD9_CALNY|nr:adenosylcobinamide-phosphate synthase CbiB [Calditerrivibrio nitroreducens]ADR20011.1 cobalamin biosynthesis protein CobD [Calditerrivibrio nitroreducens DSM 19672]